MCIQSATWQNSRNITALHICRLPQHRVAATAEGCEAQRHGRAASGDILSDMDIRNAFLTARKNWQLIAGMGTLWFSLTVSPYYPASISPALVLGDVAAVSGRHFLYALLLAACFAAIAANRKEPDLRQTRIFSATAAAMGFAGCLICLLAPAQGYGNPAITTAALALVAVYTAYYFAAWLNLASQRPPTEAVAIIGSSFVLFSALWSALIVLGEAAVGAFCVLCPAIAFAFMLKTAKDSTRTPAKEGTSSLRVLPWGIVALCLAFICFGTIAVRLFTTMGVGAANMGVLGVAPQLITSLGGLAIVAVFTVVFARHGATGFNAVSTLAVIALVNMGALLFITLADPAGLLVLAAKRVLVAAEHSAEILLIAVLAHETAKRRLPAPLVFGLTGIAIAVLPQLIGLDLMYATGLLSLLPESPYVAPLAATGAFIIAGAAIMMLIKYSRGAVDKLQIQSEQWPEELCRQATAAYDITPRELEVVICTYRGHSAKKTAETLLVSESTVKAHLSHAYRKLGVHTKQELIALVDSYRRQ